MREWLKQWSLKRKTSKGWVVGAIAIPVFLGIVWSLWLLPNHRLQTDSDRRTHGEGATLHLGSEPLINEFGAIATVAGGIFLLLKFRIANKSVETVALNGIDLNGADFRDADLRDTDLSGIDLNGANLSGANLSGVDLNGADLVSANLSGACLSGTGLRYANLSGADLRFANLSGADLRYANLSRADLNCALLSDANLSDANLSGALLFFTNLREVLNLEPFQLESKPSPFLCNVALPAYAQPTEVNPNRACSRLPQLLSTRYNIPLEEAQGIVDEARQHHWD